MCLKFNFQTWSLRDSISWLQFKWYLARCPKVITSMLTCSHLKQTFVRENPSKNCGIEKWWLQLGIVFWHRNEISMQNFCRNDPSNGQKHQKSLTKTAVNPVFSTSAKVKRQKYQLGQLKYLEESVENFKIHLFKSNDFKLYLLLLQNLHNFQTFDYGLKYIDLVAVWLSL